MATTSGQRATSTVAASQRVIDLHRPILLNEPQETPFTVFSRRLARESATDKLFKWHNDKLWERHDAINAGAGYASTITDLVVDDSNKFTVNDVVYVPRTAEVMIVTVVTVGTHTLTVERGAGASTAAALVDNEPLVIYATAFEEGSLSRTARGRNPDLVTNYTQIFKRSTEASGTLLASSNESTPHDWDHSVRKDGLDHSKDIELAAWLGTPGVETGPDGKERTLTGGLLHYMTSNNQAAGGAWTLAEIGTFIQNITRYGSDSKTFFCSRQVASVLSQHSLGKIQTEVGQTRFGVAVTEWLDANGRLLIVKQPLLETAPELLGLGVAVDFKAQAIGYRYLAGDGPGRSRDTHVKTNVQTPDRDGKKDEMITECGFRIGLPETGGVVRGVTATA